MPTQLEELRQKAAQLFEQKKYNEVIELLSNDVLKKHNDAGLYAWCARAHSRMDENDKAISYAQKAIDIDGNYWMGHLARGTALNNKGEYDKAIADYNKAIELNPKDAVAYFNRGNSWYDKGEYDKAIADCTKAIELNSDYADAYFNRGNSWYDKGEYDKAITDYNKAIELKPEDADAYLGRGVSLHNKGEYDKAMEDYCKAIEKTPDYAEAYFNRAILWDSKGEYDKAIDDFNLSIKYKPDFGGAFFYLAQTLEKKGNLLEALEKFERAKALNYSVSDAEYKIKEIKERLAVMPADADEKDQNIKKIQSIVSAIRQKSLSGKEVKQVVHYSKLNVADKVTNNCHTCLHYSNVIYMNDPDEGKKFIEYLNDFKIKQWFEKASYKIESTIFLGSFLPVNTNDEDGSAEDLLLLWRTYGRDEEGMDAGGCNFVINTEFFETGKTKTAAALPKTFKEIKEAIENGVRFTDDSRNSLLKVQYIRGNKILKDERGLMANLIKYLKQEINKFIEKNKKEVDNENSLLYRDRRIFDALQELCYLFKSADYSFEKEVRIIRKEYRNNPSIEYYKQPDGKEPEPPKQFYVKSEKRILPYLQKIYLGSKVKDSGRWILHFDHSLRQAAQSEAKDLPALIGLEDKFKKSTLDADEKETLEELRKLYPGPDATKEEIKPNEIEIIPSKCRFV